MKALWLKVVILVVTNGSVPSGHFWSLIGIGSSSGMYAAIYTVAIGVTGEPTAPDSLSGGAVNKKRERFSNFK